VSTTTAQPPPAVARTTPVPDRTIVLGVAGLAAVVAAIGLTGRSLGFDEGATAAIVSQHGGMLGRAIARDGGNMSGYYLFMHVLGGALGDSPAALRVPSAIFGVATAALVARLGIRLFDRRVGAVAGGLCAISLPLVYWAQTARGYAAMVALTTAAMSALVELEGERPRLAGAGYVTAMLLALYASFASALVVPVQLLAVARRATMARRLLIGLAAVAVGAVPLIVLALDRGSGQLFWVPRPSPKVDSQVLQSLTATGLAPSFHPSVTTTAGVVVTVLAVLALAANWLRARPRAWATGFVLAWAIVPAALTFVASLISQPVFLPRNLLTSVPAVALAVAAVICDPRLPRWLAGIALAAAVAVRLVPVIASVGISPEPWQRVTARVLGAARPGDCVAFYPLDARNPFRYYVARTGAAQRARAPRSILPAVPWGSRAPFVENYPVLSPTALDARAAGCARLWLVSSHEGQTDGSAVSFAHLARYRRLTAEIGRAFGTAPVDTEGYASAIHVRLAAGAGRQPG